MHILMKKKPQILLLVDKPNWAFDNCTKGFMPVLNNQFSFTKVFVSENPILSNYKFDAIHIFFFGEDLYKKYNLGKAKIIKEVSSHRWEDTHPYGPKTPLEAYEEYLSDADGVICVSRKLYNIFNKLHRNCFLVPNGYNQNIFKAKKVREGELVLGWAGNSSDPVKGLSDFILPSIKDKYQIKIAPGNLSHQDMNEFYDTIDILLIGSRNEGEPIPLIESMANGVFPISTNVGIVPELIDNYVNGIILSKRNSRELIKAIEWCNLNKEYIRKMQAYNSQEIKKLRNWHICSAYLSHCYRSVLNI